MWAAQNNAQVSDSTTITHTPPCLVGEGTQPFVTHPYKQPTPGMAALAGDLTGDTQ